MQLRKILLGTNSPTDNSHKLDNIEKRPPKALENGQKARRLGKGLDIWNGRRTAFSQLLA